MTLQLKTKARLFDLHCSVGLTDWDMDNELKLTTTSDQYYHDDKLNDQYVVQRPSARASRRKDEFIWYDKTSDTFVKPNLWLLVNPNIACPIQYGENAAHLQTLCEPADEIKTPQLNPAGTQHHLSTERHRFAPQNAPLQEELLHSTDYMIKNKEVSCAPAKNRRKGRTPKARDSKTLKPGCWPRPPVNYCILIALALKSSHTGSLKVQQIYSFTSFRKTCNQLCRDGKRKSCFWHLTLDGHRRLKDEIRTLTGESFKQLGRSMSRPGECDKLLSGNEFNISNTGANTAVALHWPHLQQPVTSALTDVT
ncbi:forkhead box protein R1 isoform X2 [Cottoperca gobio]|uniref:Forkhead box protein R1 isoform X2 n=1 Tax=Cottoperca gobio TaxID=56716 RepID=A0A6J2RTM0_COTGO|nr:forkhead box protein N5-like isoform X2 [Cottoperca gobio]